MKSLDELYEIINDTTVFNERVSNYLKLTKKKNSPKEIYSKDIVLTIIEYQNNMIKQLTDCLIQILNQFIGFHNNKIK